MVEKQIGEKSISAIQESVGQLIREHLQAINAAYDEAQDEDGKGSLALGLSAKIRPNARGGVDIEVGLSFVERRVKAVALAHADERQGKLNLETIK